MCIVLDKYKNIVNIEGSLVTVQAGMKIWELNEILAKHNLALPILGAIDQQTVSGAISTGTHGGSFYHTSLSGYVQALRIIRADGSVLQVDASQEIFNAIVISMGLLGIISTVTFKCVPAFSLQANKCTMSMDELLEKFYNIHQNNKYADIRYSPITDNAQVLLINPAVEAIAQNQGYHPAGSKIEQKLKTLALKLTLRLFASSRWNWLHRWSVKQYEKTIYALPSGQSDFVFTHIDGSDYEPIPLPNMEIAIPYSQACAAITVLRNYFQQTQKFPNIHVHFRCTAEENFWLSPSYKQTICWFDFWEYPYSGEFFQTMVELLKPFNFRCHWGKEISVDQEYLKQQYEKWDDFNKLRQEYDPKGMFSNSYLEKYFDKPVQSRERVTLNV